MAIDFSKKNVLVLDEKIYGNGIMKRTSIGFKERKKILSDLKDKVYTHIRGYHGCRPSDIESYKTIGLRPMQGIIEARKLAIKLFDVSEAKIKAVEMSTEDFSLRKGRVFFCYANLI